MATKTINTRIKNKIDSYQNWVDSSTILLDGEIAVVRIETGESYINPVTGQSEPVSELLMKVGNGTAEFGQLPWLSAKASDVYGWAKTQTAESVTVKDNRATGAQTKTLSAWFGDLAATDTAYGSRIAALESRTNGHTDAQINNLINTAINKLDGTTSGSGTIVKAVTQTDGKVAVTYGTLAASEIPDLASTKITHSGASGYTTVSAAIEGLNTVATGASSAAAANTAAITLLNKTDGTVGSVKKTADDAVATAINNLDYSSPSTTNSTATEFIDTVSQTNGKILATKKKLPTASTSTAGIVKLGATGGAAKYEDVDTAINTTIPALDARVVANEGKLEGITSTVSAAITSAVNALDVSEPSASGTSTTFIATAKQENGKIVVTKKNLPTASTSTAGIVKLGASGGAATHDAVFGSAKTSIASRVTAAEGDISNLKTAVAGGVHFIGVTTTDLSTSTNKASASITVKVGTGTETKSYTAASGDVVIYSAQEYIWTGSLWEPLGDVTRIGAIETAIAGMDYTGGSFGTSKFATKVTQTDGKITAEYAQPTATDIKYGDSSTVNAALQSLSADKADKSNTYTKTETGTQITNAINALDVNEPSASGTSTSFIATAKQTDGKIVVTKKNLPTASTSTAGITKLGATGGAATYDALAEVTGTTIPALDARVAANEGKLAGITNKVTDAITSAVNALDFSAPSASGSTTAFIDSVSQTNGKITATKKNITSASTTAKGIVQLNDTVTSTSTTQAATANAVKKAYDAATTAQSGVSAIKTDYVRFNATDNHMYVGETGTDYIIFDCGGADGWAGAAAASYSMRMTTPAVSSGSDGVFEPDGAASDLTGVEINGETVPPENYTVE